MGNCQAAEAATVVIQHPGGRRVERLYWPTPAGDVMRNHPGHYVALITLRLPTEQRRHPAERPQGGGGGTRVRLLRPKDMLLVGHVYRLVTSQEVMKGLQARKQENMRATARMELLKKRRLQQQQPTAAADEQSPADPENGLQVVAAQDIRGGGRQQKETQCAPGRQRQWRPSLQSIWRVKAGDRPLENAADRWGFPN